MRQEHHANGQITLLVERVAETGHFRDKKLVGNLGHDARAVTGLGVGVQSASMHQIANRAQTKAKDAIRTTSADLGNKAHTTRIVFVGRIIQRLRFRVIRVGRTVIHA